MLTGSGGNHKCMMASREVELFFSEIANSDKLQSLDMYKVFFSAMLRMYSIILFYYFSLFSAIYEVSMNPCLRELFCG